MKTFTVATVAAMATLASAQLGALPSCAITCATGPLAGTGCSLTDFACICKAQSFITGLTSCVEKSCTPAEVAQAGKAAVNLCASAGVTITLPGSGAAPSSSAAAPAPTSAAPAPSTAAPAPSSIASVPAPSSAAPVYSSSVASVPAPSSSTSCTTGAVTSTVHTMTTLTTSCTSTSTIPAVPVYTPPTTVPANATVPVVPHPTGVAPPPAYTGAASATKVTGSLVAIVAVVAGLML